MSSPAPSRPDVGVIVVAAGRGTRMGGEPKQFRELAGVPMLLHAVRPFLAHPEVVTVAAALPAEVAAAPPPWLERIAGDRLRLVAGGTARADSVRAGLAVLPSGCEVVLVHDGARPFPGAGTIDAVIAAARAGTSAVAALQVTDTLKEADGALGVVRTVARERLWRAQTPQGFPRRVLERAHREAADRAEATDDAQLVEALGEPVTLVPDSVLNFKVTTVEDLVMAGAIAQWLGR